MYTLYIVRYYNIAFSVDFIILDQKRDEKTGHSDEDKVILC